MSSVTFQLSPQAKNLEAIACFVKLPTTVAAETSKSMNDDVGEIESHTNEVVKQYQENNPFNLLKGQPSSKPYKPEGGIAQQFCNRITSMTRIDVRAIRQDQLDDSRLTLDTQNGAPIYKTADRVVQAWQNPNGQNFLISATHPKDDGSSVELAKLWIEEHLGRIGVKSIEFKLLNKNNPVVGF